MTKEWDRSDNFVPSRAERYRIKAEKEDNILKFL